LPLKTNSSPALASIHAEWKSAGPPGQSGKLHPPINAHNAVDVATQRAPFSNREIGYPIEVHLVREIKSETARANFGEKSFANRLPTSPMF